MTAGDLAYWTNSRAIECSRTQVLRGIAALQRPWSAPRLRRLTLTFGGVFVLRALVQAPVYLTDRVTALGIAKVVLGGRCTSWRWCSIPWSEPG